MAEAPRTFSESWYRVADLRVSLRPHVRARIQYFRGEKWHVLEDPFNNSFYRLRPAAYQFVSRLTPNHTVEEVWTQSLERDPDSAPGQEDVIELLTQLHHANLLLYRSPGDSARIFERFRKRRQREIQSTFLNVMFARFPLLDPDRFIRRTLPVARILMGPLGVLLWVAVVALGGKVVADHATELWNQAESVLAPGNILLLYAAFALAKIIHEFGHAYACRYYGGEVHIMGIMLLVFTPVPYVDVTASWAFRSRWQRILVGSAGMLVEIFIAACAALVWANTGPSVAHSLAYNVMFAASVSTIIFNGNPLLRFDGYYILSDLLDIPNLYSRSIQHFVYLAERYAFGCRNARSLVSSRVEGAWLVIYGVASQIYRTVVFIGIIFFVGNQWLLIGILMAVTCTLSWVVYPLGKFLFYLAGSPRLDRTRLRAVVLSALVAGVVLAALGVIPFPRHFRSPGVLEATQYTAVVNRTAGYIDQVLTSPGTPVKSGQPLLRLKDPELAFQLALAEARYREARFIERRAFLNGMVDLMPVRSHLRSVEDQLTRLREQMADLTLTAAIDGQWVAPDLENRLFTGGQDANTVWLPQGTPSGFIVDGTSFDFVATVSQEEASPLFKEKISGSEIRLWGDAGTVLPVADLDILPAERQRLPSAALGWSAGGEVPVDLEDRSGQKAAESFYQVRARIGPTPGTTLFHGRSGKIRFDLASQPLLQQWYRTFRQALQRRYKI